MKRKDNDDDTSTEQRRKSTGATRQTQLTNFLQARPVQILKQSKEGSAPIVFAPGDSSDEDELMATAQLLKRKSDDSHVAPPKQRETAHSFRATARNRQSSPIPDNPVYIGAFNLAALLADRENRLHDKARIAKLNDDSSLSGTSNPRHAHPEDGEHSERDRKRIHDATSKVQSAAWLKFVQPRSDQVMLDNLNRAALRAVSTTLNMQFTTIDQFYHFLSSAVFCQYQHLLWQSPESDKVMKCIIYQILHTTDQRIVYMSRRGLQGCPNIARSIYDGLTQCVQNDDTPCESGTTTSAKSRNGETFDSLMLRKIRALLSLLNSAIEGINQERMEVQAGESQDNFISEVLTLTIKMSTENVYGALLIPELEILSQHCMKAFTSQDRLNHCLWNMTDEVEQQIHVVCSLPYVNDMCRKTAQISATQYFLNETEVEENSERRVELMADFLSSSLPFHPLSSATNYQEITGKIALLSLALRTIPKESSIQVTRIIKLLQTMHGHIVDGKAAFMARSEAKAAIQRLSDRLRYTLTATTKKRNIFEVHM